MRCEHPECTGVHGNKRPYAELCPDTRRKRNEGRSRRKKGHPEKERERQRRYYLNNIEKFRERDRGRQRSGKRRPRSAEENRERRLRREYGMTQGDYDSLLSKQNYVCAVCGRSDSGNKTSQALFVHHDHETGLVLGLLCHRCNVLCGALLDRADLAESLFGYLHHCDDLREDYIRDNFLG